MESQWQKKEKKCRSYLGEEESVRLSWRSAMDWLSCPGVEISSSWLNSHLMQPVVSIFAAAPHPPPHMFHHSFIIFYYRLRIIWDERSRAAEKYLHVECSPLLWFSDPVLCDLFIRGRIGSVGTGRNRNRMGRENEDRVYQTLHIHLYSSRW